MYRFPNHSKISAKISNLFHSTIIIGIYFLIVKRHDIIHYNISRTFCKKYDQVFQLNYFFTNFVIDDLCIYSKYL